MNNDKTNISHQKNNISDDKTVVMTSIAPHSAEIVEQTRVDIRQNPDIESDAYLNETNQEIKLPYIGDTVRDRFVLESLLGIGGMGAVYSALDKRKQEAEDENPYVAIKLLSEDFRRHPKAFISLQRETQKTQALAHPNIVTVYDFDRDGDVVYMTMEKLQGKTLEQIIREHALEPLDRDKALSIIRGITAGLVYAHSKGIVHSDLKPGNIFVTESNQVKILDFGIARIVQENAQDGKFDAGELSALTPSYASIEMINQCDPDRRDDIYALGVIACELLGDQHPYKRLMATEALEQKLSPKLPEVGRLLKKVLNSAVELELDKRVESLEIWLKKLDFAVGGYKRLLGVFLLIICAAIGNLVYLDIAKEPEVALSDLTAEQQTSFGAFMLETNMAMKFNDINGALFYLDKAYKIHAQNPEVNDVIKAIILKIESSVESKGMSSENLQALIITLNEYDAFKNEKIQTQLKQLIP